MLEQMQAEKDIGKSIRRMQREKHKRQQMGESANARVSFSRNPNGAADSEKDVNMNKRAVRSDGESQPDKCSKRSISERIGCAKAYDSPPNKEVRKYQNQYATGYIGEKEQRKGNGNCKGHGGAKEERQKQGRGCKILLPGTRLRRPDSQDAKSDGDMPTERRDKYHNGCVGDLYSTDEKGQPPRQNEKRSIARSKGGGGMRRKTSIRYIIQSWPARMNIDKIAQTAKEESEDTKNRKS